MLKKYFILAVALVMAASVASAQNSKATAADNTAVYCTYASSNTGSLTLPVSACTDIYTGATVATDGDYVTVMSHTVKLSASQSLFVSPSTITGLYTDTQVKVHGNSGGSDYTSTATGFGGVYMRAVLVNQATGAKTYGYPAADCTGSTLGCTSGTASSGVVIDSRTQSLSQTLSGCDTTAGCNFSLITSLLLQTTSAHTFNFIFPNVGQGTYEVQIQEAVSSTASDTGGAAIGAAAFGLGSVTIQTVRLVHNFSF